MKLLGITVILSVLISVNSFAQTTKNVDKEDFIVTADNQIQIPQPEIEKKPTENPKGAIRKNLQSKKPLTLNKKAKVNTAHKKGHKPAHVYRGILPEHVYRGIL